MNTQDAANAFLNAKRVKGLAPKTIQNYRGRLTYFASLHPSLPEHPEPIEAFLSDLATEHVRDAYFRLLKTLYRWLSRRKLIDFNPIPDIEAPQLRKRVARSLSISELELLLAHPSHSQQMRAYLYLLADTGLRLSEALSVSGPGNFRDGFVVVDGKEGERIAPISENVELMVRAALPWPWTIPDSASNAVRKAFKMAGLGGKRASAQTLRHTFADMWEGEETDLVGIMGWTTNRMLNVYRRFNTKRAKARHMTNSPIRRIAT